jgi:DNA-binding transcriptional LysR family regulator
MPIIHDVDLNLFRLLHTLYEERSVTRTAERLFITPSAVSHALRRLRLMLQDELFVRGPRGMMPTHRAHEVAHQLSALLPQLNDVITPQAFDPALTERIFALSCVPYLSSAFLPSLAVDFAARAPHARLDVRLLYSSVVDDLDSGALDIALGNFRRTPPRLVAEEILREPYLWVTSAANPIARSRKLTLKALAGIPHVDLLIDGAVTNPVDSYDVRQGLERLVVQNSMGATEQAFAEAGLSRDVRFHAPDSVSAMAIVARTEAACLVPETIARIMAPVFRLATFEPPYRSGPLVIQMLYHAQFGAKPAVRWLLDRIKATAQPIA